MLVFGSMVLAVLLRLSAGQDANCDFTQNMQAGQTYYIDYSYPRNAARQCRWIGIAPSGYRSRLDCPTINLPASSGCSMDRLLISRSGDPQLNNADVYCGRGTTTAVSTGRQISIGLITSSQTTGGSFTCQLTSQPDSPTPTCSCGYKKSVGLITSSQTTGGSFTCQLTSQPDSPTPTCSCGYKKSNRIVGGQETGANEFPMMAGVVYLDQQMIRCGGTIIDKRYVVTAAHCVVGRSPSDLAVVVGEHDTSTGAESPSTQGLLVERITIHTQYTASNYDYDIAVLRTTSDMVFSDRVGPACLPFKFTGDDFTGRKFTLLGWGTLFFGGPTSNTLQKVDVNVISQSSCQQRVSTLTPRQICTYSSGKDSCQDDSGGPALYTDPSTNLLHLTGIISFGRSCAEANQPGVQTRVPVLLDWIQNNTPGAQYCRK